MKILCSGYIVRYPLGGMTSHHLQYLVGFQQLGHEVIYFEDAGWDNSCYDPSINRMTDDPSYGVRYLQDLADHFGFSTQWCYLSRDGTAYGMPREVLAAACRESDVYFNLSNMNWIPELEQCRRRVLVDTDPVFCQIGFGMSGSLANYHTLFTFGENVHREGCDMPTAGASWLPTRQPVVLDLWPVSHGDSTAAITTVMSWSAYGDREFDGRTFGQKDREFQPFFNLPKEISETMEIALSAPTPIKERMMEGGWRLADPCEVTHDLWTYRNYLQQSRAEFSVAKHAYVSTRCGWFSDRSAVYLASGRPVIVQDTGFSDFLPCGEGLLPFRDSSEAVQAIRQIKGNYADHCRAARHIAEDYFDASKVLSSLLEASVN